jgi:DNA-binding beta-propeller fold protein YncE
MNTSLSGMTRTPAGGISRRAALRRLGLAALGGAALAAGSRFGAPLTGRSNASADTSLVDQQGRLWVSQPSKHTILRADNAFTAPLVRYAGVSNTAGLRNGARLQALFNTPTELAINAAGTRLYVVDSANRAIRTLNINTGDASTAASAATAFAAEGVATWQPAGVDVDPMTGNLVISDAFNHVVWMWNRTTGQMTVLAGSPGQAGNADGYGRNARFTSPKVVKASADGLVFNVAQSDRVRVVERTGHVSTIGVAG